MDTHPLRLVAAPAAALALLGPLAWCHCDGSACNGQSCDAGGDPRCSVANCQGLIDGCRYALASQLIPSGNNICFALARDAGVDSGYNVYQDCVRACVFEAAGAIVACIAAGQQSCIDAFKDGGTVALDRERAALLAQCAPSDGGQDASCLQGCQSNRQSCDNGCPTTSVSACFDCQVNCGETAATCYNACP